jgi:hypothetical protein
MRRSPVALLLLLSTPIFAVEGVLARFSAGQTSFVDDGSDRHTTLGGSVRFYVTRRWSVEPEYLYERSNSNHSDHLFWGNFAYDFRDREKKIVPYWFGSVGLIHTTTRFGSAHFDKTEAAGSTGAGARFFLTERIFVGPQVRFGFADAVFGEITGSVGFVIRK